MIKYVLRKKAFSILSKAKSLKRGHIFSFSLLTFKAEQQSYKSLEVLFIRKTSHSKASHPRMIVQSDSCSTERNKDRGTSLMDIRFQGI